MKRAAAFILALVLVSAIAITSFADYQYCYENGHVWQTVRTEIPVSNAQRRIMVSSCKKSGIPHYHIQFFSVYQYFDECFSCHIHRVRTVTKIHNNVCTR